MRNNNTTLIIPFCNYEPTQSIGILLFDYWMSKINKLPVSINNVYLVGGTPLFDNTTQTISGKNVRKIFSLHGGHQDNMLCGVQNMVGDDGKFVLIDSDLMVYDYSLFDDLINDLDNYDVITHFDGATRYGNRRFTHWIYASTKQFFINNSANFTDGCNYEPMEPLTINTYKNYPNVKVKELTENRTNVGISNFKKSEPYLPEQQWLTHTMNSKYYHVRNFGNIAAQIKNLNTMSVEQIKHAHLAPWSDRNYGEMIRLIAWNMVILEKLNMLNEYRDKINNMLVNTEQPDLYSNEFQTYYRLFQYLHRTHLL